MVVPILAPNMIPTVCSKRISPALTKPMVMAVVAEDDCITTVTANPMSKPIQALLVYRSMMSRSLSPANDFNPSPINLIPNRNNPNPPRIVCQLMS